MRRFWVHALGLGLSGTFLLGCGGGKPSSDLKISNGKTIEEAEFPSVVLLQDPTVKTLCTGTFIADDTVITAAHCTYLSRIDSEGNASGKMNLVRRKTDGTETYETLATTVSMVRNPLWDKNGKGVNKFDLALLRFPKGTSRTFSEFASQPVAPGDAFIIVGYGLYQSQNLYDLSSEGIKRMGENTIDLIEDGFLRFKGQASTSAADGSDASPSSGDSGGPLFIQGKLAGITSGGGFESGSVLWTSLYVNLQSPESQEFLAKNLPAD